MFKKAKIIAKAWVKVAQSITTEEDKRRARICKGCPLSKHKKYLDFINDELKEVKGLVCTDCGCPLSAKIRSEDLCIKWKL